MDFKIMSLLSGAIGAMILIPLLMPNTLVSPVPQITISSAKVPDSNSSVPPLPGKLALSQEQEEQISIVNWKVNYRVDQILTVEQQREFKTALDRGLRPATALDSISSLSTRQKDELLSAFRFAQKEIENILTPEQLEYIKQRQENRYNNQQQSKFKFKRANQNQYMICSLKA